MQQHTPKSARSTISLEGFLAAVDGYDLYDNPHTFGTLSASLWSQGWEDAVKCGEAQPAVCRTRAERHSLCYGEA